MKSSVILTIRKPGAMSNKERAGIVLWLRKQAESLSKRGADYNDTGNFTARILDRGISL